MEVSSQAGSTVSRKRPRSKKKKSKSRKSKLKQKSKKDKELKQDANNNESVLDLTINPSHLQAFSKPIKPVPKEAKPKTNSGQNQRFFMHRQNSETQNVHVESNITPKFQQRSRTQVVFSPQRPTVPTPRTPLPTAITTVAAASYEGHFANATYPRAASTSPRKSFHEFSPSSTRRSYDNQNEMLHKLKKVFLSDRQSGNINVLGTDLPCAPPATPTMEMMQYYEYVPSMGDIRVSSHMLGVIPGGRLGGKVE